MPQGGFGNLIASRRIATSSASAWKRSHGRRPGTFNPPFPNHATMYGAVLIAAPLKIVNGSGSPLRVIALTPA
jgi:hypothetical protein